MAYSNCATYHNHDGDNDSDTLDPIYARLIIHWRRAEILGNSAGE